MFALFMAFLGGTSNGLYVFDDPENGYDHWGWGMAYWTFGFAASTIDGMVE